jgi:hypothetical protein
MKFLFERRRGSVDVVQIYEFMKKDSFFSKGTHTQGALSLTTFSLVPSMVLAQILGNLNARDMCTLAQTCKDWKRMVS